MILAALNEIRSFAGSRRTVGLSDETIARFAATDPDLERTVDDAVARHREMRAEFPEILALDEPEQVTAIQGGFVNFYADSAINPYVALAGHGPWIVTSKGAVLHDSGGYGMLGLGHAPDAVIDAMARPQVMANVMTASFSQLRLVRSLEREIGRHRAHGSPFSRFVCLNSGSEAVTLAARLCDINAKIHTDPQGTCAGSPIKILALEGGFHGRTDRPAQFSDSTRTSYKTHLASFRDRDNLLTVPPNDSAQLREAFASAKREGWFIEAVFVEPVMGEGNPGMAITREFYDTARVLTAEHDCLLVVDSIQAGLRAHGVLSIVDYPGFENAEIPDIESYSKALNAGQYPLSVLALTERAAGLYRAGVYGNTMTTNPRAMDVAATVLESMTDELRENIRERGAEMKHKLGQLRQEIGGLITGVQGTGLLLSAELDPAIRCYGNDSVEEWLRIHGIGVIHGGTNSLRYTPHFAITSDEIDLIVETTRAALLAHAARNAISDGVARQTS